MSRRIPPWLVAILAVAIGAVRALGEPTPIACGETQIHPLGPGLHELTFAAQPGEVVSATVVPLVPVPGFVPRWRMKDVEGHRIKLSSGSHRCIGRCETEPLPAGGTFRLRVADSGVNVGLFAITLEAVSATANGASNGPPSPACARMVNGQAEGTVAVTFGQSEKGTIEQPGDTDSFTILALPGVSLGITLTRTGGQPAFAPVWDAFDVLGRNIGHGVAGQTGSVTSTGVVTILVGDAERTATGTYTLTVGPAQPTTTVVTTSTTSTTGEGQTTTSTGSDVTTSTGVTTTTGETTTTVDVTTTTGDVTTTTSDVTTTTSDVTTTTSDVTTTTTDAPSTTTTSASPQTTSTSATVPGSTTTTLAPLYDLGFVLQDPAIETPPMLGRALASDDGRLVIGSPHADAPRPAGGGTVPNAGVALVLDVSGAIGSPTFGTVLATLAKPPTPTSNDEFGAAVAIDGSTVVVGVPGARTAYIFPDVESLGTAPLPMVPPVDEDDRFGELVAIAGDLVVVGAPSAGERAGIAYVFERATGAPHAVLAPPEAIAGARFGASIAACGPLVLVGAPGNASVPGRAFLYDPATGTLVQTFDGENPAPADEFGAAVACADGDPLIGAPGSGGGRVTRHEPSGGAPTRTFVSPTAPNECFGAAIAIEDGLMAVGAPCAVRNGVTAGAVYVFDVLNGALQDALQKPVPEAGDALGTSVAIDEGRVVAGAPADDTGTTDGGTAFVFEDGDIVAAFRERLSRTGFGAAVVTAGATAFYAGAPELGSEQGFVEQVDATGAVVRTFPPPQAEPTRFGSSIAAIGTTVVIGAPETSTDDGDRVGAVHVWADAAASPTTIANPDPQPGDEFGFAVGDVDGDILASSPFAGETDTGLVYRIDPATGQPVKTYGQPTPAGADFFGADVAGDDGQVLVGAPLDASGGAPAGAVYLFDAAEGTVVHAIPNPNGSQDLFGSAVALGQWIVVGAPFADDDGIGVVGTVWIFDRATGSLLRRIENPSPGRFDSFGASLALLDDRLLVGAPRADGDVLDTGVVYVFDATNGRLVTEPIKSPPQGFFDNFGFAVAASSAGLLVGSPGPGRVYLFDDVTSAAGIARLVPRGITATSQCGNGLVEDGEACDDGNGVDDDDCRSDCTRGLCCAIDDLRSRCDDGNPCTTDVHDPVIGCRYEPSGAPGCCESDADCPGQQCRLCVGCFLFDWDCCAEGSRCIAGNPLCSDKTCLDAAFCQCAGNLSCDGEAIPDELKKPFDDACSILLVEASVEPDGTPVTKEEIILARQHTRNARLALRKTMRTARELRRQGAISKQCRKQVAQQARAVRKAIPRGKKLRRCLKSG